MVLHKLSMNNKYKYQIEILPAVYFYYIGVPINEGFILPLPKTSLEALSGSSSLAI